VADTQPAEPKAPNVDVTGRISPDEPPKKARNEPPPQHEYRAWEKEPNFNSTNHYEVLGVGESATAEQITSTYRKLAAQHYPKDGGTAETSRIFQKINEARDTLKDPFKRMVYDAHLRMGTSPTEPEPEAKAARAESVSSVAEETIAKKEGGFGNWVKSVGRKVGGIKEAPIFEDAGEHFVGWLERAGKIGTGTKLAGGAAALVIGGAIVDAAMAPSAAAAASALAFAGPANTAVGAVNTPQIDQKMGSWVANVPSMTAMEEAGFLPPFPQRG